MDKQMVAQYFNFIKQAGYQYSKDELGYYFDNGLKRFSVMKTGPFLRCYFNKKEKGQWVLKDKTQPTTDLIQCLAWVLKQIQTGS